MKIQKAGGVNFYYTGHLGNFEKGIDENHSEVYYQENARVVISGTEYEGTLYYDRIEKKFFMI